MPSNYAIDSHPDNEEIWLTIEQVALTQDGLPTEGVSQLLESWCIWEIAGHTVAHEKSPEDFSI